MPVGTHYAKSGDLRIAYQVVGDGPLDLVFVPGFISNLDHSWDEPNLAHFLDRLSSFSRLILFDKRGTGLSDRMGNLPSLEERMDDVRAVMDAVSSRKAALFGISEGGALSMLFAATYPERTQGLMLYGTYAEFHTWVLPPARFETFLDRIDRSWGQGESLHAFAPTRVADERFRQWWARFERLGASPSAVIALMRMNSQIDLRHILPTIRVPTLVMHRSGDTRVDVEGGRYIAAHIPGAKYVELPGTNHVLWADDASPVAHEIEAFLTGTNTDFEPDRVLSTVLFTDIVDSTRQAETLGDRRWRSLLDRHDRIVRGEIDRFRGREIKTLGDGFLATFDGPARAVRCAGAIIEALKALDLRIRCGVHTGEIEVKGDDIGGIAVHIASRIAALADGREVLVSRTVRDLVAGSNLHLEDRGAFALKGLSESMPLFAAAGSQGT
ncbi:adenylate/guanylate cyclase domain-containing protein [Microvirga pudoricolor]|uniref:adenylate/guanylate cyclase domain-containing protein n=1 Tax=Microvirga pudoricolor TaxID=2778729 RepID=UPI00194F1B2A|nr:adenylate/guanylate cyclase domain-containing protein [Microvirga pudoricolor]MBM6594954.1 adenylate/guanylate cyclase domain-containing protein [Microvirga pudoricolor]